MPTEIYRETRFKLYEPGEPRPADFEGTNPETCRHNVITVNIIPLSGKDGLFDSIVFCISCDTNLSGIWRTLGKNYEYDISHGVWVHVPIKPSRSEQVARRHEINAEKRTNRKD